MQRITGMPNISFIMQPGTNVDTSALYVGGATAIQFPEGITGAIFSAPIGIDSSRNVRTGLETSPASTSAYLCIKY
jgi:hypothetical protein